MAKNCSIDNMDVDGEVTGDVIEVENYEGTEKRFIVGNYRQASPTNIYCNDCGSDIPIGGLIDISEAIKEHLEEQ